MKIRIGKKLAIVARLTNLFTDPRNKYYLARLRLLI